WKGTMDGALAGTEVESFPWPAPIGGQAGVPADPGIEEPEPEAPVPGFRLPDFSNLPPITIPAPPVQLPVPVPPQIEVFPGVTIQIPGL
ncbi:MAG: transglycosylase domain-containing protein, partial [Rhodococcus sp. (in: high G+C Gram-positive bacteria)]